MTLHRNQADPSRSTQHAFAMRRPGRFRTGFATGLAVVLTVAGLTVATGFSVAFAAATPRSYIQVVGGNYAAYGLTSDGTIYAWGSDTFGQIGSDSGSPSVPAPVVMNSMSGKTITQLASARATAFALADDGTIYAWGANFHGTVGDGTTTDRSTPVPVDLSALAGKTVTQVAAANESAYALASDGTIYAWGANYDGRLGDGSTTPRSSPVQVDMSAMVGDTITHIAAGDASAYALASDGSIYAWGDNGSGQLGDGSMFTDRHTAIEVNISAMVGDTITQIAAGGSTAYALAADGSIYAWGAGTYGQVGDGSTSSRPTPVAVNMAPMAGKTITQVAAAHATAFAIATDGSIYAWGNNTQGTVGDGYTTHRLSPVPVALGAMTGKTMVAVAAGYSTAYALSAGGFIYAWGLNSDGQVGNGMVGPSNPGFTTPVRAALQRSPNAATTIDQPRTGIALDTSPSVAADASYTAGAVTWARGAYPADSTAAAGVAYTATITLIAQDGYTFTGFTSTATVNGATAVVEHQAGGATLKLRYTFPATEKHDQSPLTIVDPGPQTYGSGGFTLETVGGSGFGAVSYTTAPANNVLQVSTDGKVSILGPGTAIITAVKASDASFKQASATLSVTVAPAHFAGALTPHILGTAQEGNTLSVFPSTTTDTGLTPVPSALAYQWYAAGSPIAGATDAQFSLGSTLAGQTISVKVTATRTGFVPVTAHSASMTVTPSPVPPIPPAPPVTATVPSKMNAPQVSVRGRKAIVRWRAAASNGSRVTRYVIDISRGKDKTVRARARKTAFRGLKPGKYRIRIAARNAFGLSPYSTRVKIRIR